MTTTEKIAYKNQLKDFCIAILQKRIDTSRHAINTAQESSNNEEKSSAGDKYETGRAMAHLEKDMHARQLAANTEELAKLHAVDVNRIYSGAVQGALVSCPGTSFFIIAGIGVHKILGKTIIFLSPFAPLARSLLSKQQGDQFLFREANKTITEIY
jgi:hypothetical protein